MSVNALVVSDCSKLQEIRCHLEGAGYYDNTRRIAKVENGSFALPITPHGATELTDALHRTADVPVGDHTTVLESILSAHLISMDLPESKRSISRNSSEYRQLQSALSTELSKVDGLTSEELSKLAVDLPKSWERHGDLIVLPKGSFTNPRWQKLGWDCLWKAVAKALKCARIAVGGRVACDGFRTSSAELVLGNDGWVDHVDNGVKYTFDVTKSMFSSGNISEKIRVANLKCVGETVVDLYAGIGYFTLPYLVHAKAKVVHACEWSPHAVEALRRSLAANGVEDRCTVHFGDNREVAPKQMADRVNLGLLPSSEAGWPVACAALRPDTGGWLHVHGNVSSKPGSLEFAERNPWELECSRTRSSPVESQPSASNFTSLQGVTESGSSLIPGVTESGSSLIQGVTESGSSLIQGVTESGSSLIQRVTESPSVQKDKDTESFLTQPSCGPVEPVHSRWGAYVGSTINDLLARENALPNGRRWRVDVKHIERVKSYAPHVDHLVADIECRPYSFV